MKVRTILATLLTFAAAHSSTLAMEQCKSCCGGRHDESAARLRCSRFSCRAPIHVEDCCHDHLFRCRSCRCAHSYGSYPLDDYGRNRLYAGIYMHSCIICAQHNTSNRKQHDEYRCDDCTRAYEANQTIYSAWKEKECRRKYSLPNAVQSRVSTLGIREPAPGFLEALTDGSLGSLFVREQRKRTVSTQTE